MQVSTMGIDLGQERVPGAWRRRSGEVVITKKLRRSQVLRCSRTCRTASSDGSLRHVASLGARARGARTRCAADAGELREGVRQARQERRCRCGGDICEAVTRPSMRFVAVNTAEQQAVLMLHRTRDMLVRQRTQLINAMRAHLAQLGLVAAQGREGLRY